MFRRPSPVLAGVITEANCLVVLAEVACNPFIRKVQCSTALSTLAALCDWFCINLFPLGFLVMLVAQTTEAGSHAIVVHLPGLVMADL